MPGPSIFTSVINSYLPEPHASLLNGIIFGIDLKSSKDFYMAIKRTGLLHLVVLSGINITILSAIVATATSWLSKKISVIITMLTIVGFIVFVGAEPPIIRAGFTGILSLVAILYGRKNIALYGLFLSALFIAVFWPEWITTISFQLSYSATLGIILLSDKLILKSNKKNKVKYWQIWFWNEAKTTLAAYFFTMPIIWFNFKQISLVAPLSNLLVSCIIPPLMIFGFATAVFGKINFWLGIIPGYICYGMTSYLVFIIQTTARLPLIFFSW